MIITIIRYLKNFVDKLYYNKYNLWERETLIRQMFPWINKVWEYETLNLFLKDKSLSDLDQLLKTLMSYYWWEVARHAEANNTTAIREMKGLLDFCQSVKDYINELYNLNIK